VAIAARTDSELDLRLVAASQQGDRRAFGELVRRHREMLAALCRRALGDAELAEDAAQEAVLLALIELGRLRRPERFGPWLCGIGLNVCRRWLRERSRESRSWAALAGGRVADWPPPDPGQQELLEAAELAARMRAAIAELPEGQRAAVALFYLSGLTQVEVAAHLGTSVAAVKTRLHKGRAGLRERLEPWWREEYMGSGPVNEYLEMRVVDVRLAVGADDAPARHVVLLEEVDGERQLPIWIGEHEALAIAMTLQGRDLPRPGTYRFAAGLLDAAGSRLREVVLNRLAEEIFYAEAVLEGPQGERRVDARPSDALNLALVAGAPIRADAAVVEAARRQANPWDERVAELPRLVVENLGPA
jgi:RNA polymerase sigma factor (sigma-70 family)